MVMFEPFDTLEPLVGEVMETVGRVISGIGVAVGPGVGVGAGVGVGVGVGVGEGVGGGITWQVAPEQACS